MGLSSPETDCRRLAGRPSGSEFRSDILWTDHDAPGRFALLRRRRSRRRIPAKPAVARTAGLDNPPARQYLLGLGSRRAAGDYRADSLRMRKSCPSSFVTAQDVAQGRKALADLNGHDAPGCHQLQHPVCRRFHTRSIAQCVSSRSRYQYPGSSLVS